MENVTQPLDWQGVQQSIAGLTFVRRIVFHPSLPSTNLFARDLVRTESSHGTVVVTDDQTQGRGRLGRSWSVPPGSGLTFSLCLLLQRQLPVHTLTPVAALAVHDAVQSLVSSRCSIKWPNDVLIDGLKVSGILIELGDIGVATSAIVGIGINVNAAPDLPHACSLASATGHTLARESVFVDVLGALDTRLKAATTNPSALMNEWRASLSTLGRRVHARTPIETIEGVALDVDGYGSLLIRLDNGSVRSLPAAELTLPPV